jgi:hypothetical protein
MMAHHERIITIKIFASGAPINPKLVAKIWYIHGTTTRVETLAPHKRSDYHNFPPTC